MDCRILCLDTLCTVCGPPPLNTCPNFTLIESLDFTVEPFPLLNNVQNSPPPFFLFPYLIWFGWHLYQKLSTCSLQCMFCLWPLIYFINHIIQNKIGHKVLKHINTMHFRFGSWMEPEYINLIKGFFSCKFL